MILNIPLVPVSANRLRREFRNPFAYKGLREQWENAIAYAPGNSGDTQRWQRTAAGNEKIRLNVRVYHKQNFDQDNLVASLKPIIDALKNVRFIRDDGPKFFELGTIEQIVSSDTRTILHLVVVDEPEAA